MTRLGLPVPPGFTITTDACRAYLVRNVEPAGLEAEVDGHLHALEERMGRHSGSGGSPAPASAVGSEVLDAGDDGDGPGRRPHRPVGRRPGPAKRRRAIGDRIRPPTAEDVRRTVLGNDDEEFAGPLEELSRTTRVPDAELTADDLRRSSTTSRRSSARTPARTPVGPACTAATGDPRRVHLVDTPRAALYRCRRTYPGRSRYRGVRAGDGVGNHGESSGSGVASPATPRPVSVVSTATTWSTPRGRMWSPASATPSARGSRRAGQGVI